jgi:stage 0 sporulation protein B (sporulation initiation phosphotransferase)
MPEGNLWVLVSITILILVCMVIGLKWKRQQEKLLTEMKEKKDLELIRTLDHHRHDWMNDVQVLFGYIQLNKREKLLAYIERLGDQMKREGLISKLGIPFLVSYFISFRASTNLLVLNVNLDKEISLAGLGEQGSRTAQLIITIVEAYRCAAGIGEGDANTLSITMDMADQQLFIEFEYNGKYDIEQLSGNLRGINLRIQEYKDTQISSDLSDQAADVDVRLRLTE